MSSGMLGRKRRMLVHDTWRRAFRRAAVHIPSWSCIQQDGWTLPLSAHSSAAPDPGLPDADSVAILWYKALLPERRVLLPDMSHTHGLLLFQERKPHASRELILGTEKNNLGPGAGLTQRENLLLINNQDWHGLRLHACLMIPRAICDVNRADHLSSAGSVLFSTSELPPPGRRACP